MKLLRNVLAVAVLALLCAVPASAQFVQGIQLFSAITNAVTGTNALTVAASATTNLPTTLANTIVVGSKGFGISVYASCASASLATNTLVFEYTGDGQHWVTAPTWSVFTTNNTTTASTLFTNFPPTLQNNDNLRAIRLKYITNSTAAVTFWTNILVGIRQ